MLVEEYVDFALTLRPANSPCLVHAKTKLRLERMPCHKCMEKVQEMIARTELPEQMAFRALDMPGRVKELGIKP